MSFARIKNNNISMNEIEEGDRLSLDFTKIASIAKSSPDVIPVAVQNAETKEIILIAYTNLPALEKTIETKIATFWSTSRNELWIKGKTSGNYFEVVDIFVNCEQNSLVYVVTPKGHDICHTFDKNGLPRNCYYRKLDFNTNELIKFKE